MKKVIVTLGIVLYGFSLMGQVPDTANIRTEEYCSVVLIVKGIKPTNNAVTVDYGTSEGPQTILDANGKPVTFTGIPEVLNLMNESGWEFAFSMQTAIGSLGTTTCILRRKTNNHERTKAH